MLDENDVEKHFHFKKKSCDFVIANATHTFHGAFNETHANSKEIFNTNKKCRESIKHHMKIAHTRRSICHLVTQRRIAINFPF